MGTLPSEVPCVLAAQLADHLVPGELRQSEGGRSSSDERFADFRSRAGDFFRDELLGSFPGVQAYSVHGHTPS